MDADPKESADLAPQQKDVTARLTQMALDWRAALPKVEGGAAK
jgi:hypothetical protein